MEPIIAEEWCIERNNLLSAFNVTPHSNKKAWWVCRKNKSHIYKSAICDRTRKDGKATNCPYCAGILPSQENNFKDANHLIAAEWHPTKNKLNPKDYTTMSGKKVWWLCPKRHEWEASISSRMNGSGCPVCAGQKIIFETSLKFLNPELAEEWHTSKNGDLKPEEIGLGSNKKIWWKCKRNENHEWKATVSNRNNGTGCPICASEMKTSFPEQMFYFYLSQVFIDVKNRYVLGKTNKGRKLEADIYISKIKFAIEYDGHYHKDIKKDEQKNKLIKEKGIYLVRVRIPELPLLKDGTNTLIHNYLDKDSLKNCLLQLGEIICSTNNLSSIEKEKINDWSNTKLDIDRFKIYEQYYTLEKENSVASKRPDLLEEWDYEKNKGIKPEYVSIGSQKRIYWICKNNKEHKWVATVGHRTNGGTGCPFCSGRKISIDNCLYTLFPELSEEWDYRQNDLLTPFDVGIGSNKKVWWQCKKDPNHIWDAIIYSRTRGNGCPFCSGKKTDNKNSLFALYPDLVSEWHPTKNLPLSSKDVTPGSHKKVWWQCKDDPKHIWEAVVYSRTSGRGCPFCAKK